MGNRDDGLKQLRGAKASNAGDDFHILWALRHALRLLDASSGLTAVTVEGIPVQARGSHFGSDEADWEGVDVALFYGGDGLESAQRIEFQQLKYSTASPDHPWTVARLCYASNKAKDNSVIARLAKAFSAAHRRARELKPGALTIKLVSNQPLADEVTAALAATALTTPEHQMHRGQLRAAAGLAPEEFEHFARSLDFSDCRGPTRFAVQQRVIAAIAEIASSDARAMMLELRHLVYSRMLPESNEAPITREAVLAALYVNDIGALLPCPAHLEPPLHIVSRRLVREIAEKRLHAQSRICLHGEGGCGKTTALLELQTRLPQGSELVIFDCYGGGSYLDSDGQRHLPGHALLHLCNELAARVGAPMLVLGMSGADYPRALMARLRKAADIVRARDPHALLVLAIDAADNSITAAASKTPAERSFVHDIVSLGDLPDNVRVIVTCRTGRLPELRLPSEFISLLLGDFNELETAEFVDRRSPTLPASPAWITDLHRLSEGNARVIAYALKYGEETSQDPLNYLNPHGKDLARIFEERVTDALRRGGNMQQFERLCGALIALPRPIPSRVLAAVAGVSEAALKDAANDLAPGLRYVDEQVGFSDEDFEAFIRGHATDALMDTYRRAANLFLRDHAADSYSAEHAATMLWLARDTEGLIRFVQAHPDPKAIRDPVRRREVHLQRLKLSMQVARAHGGTVEAVQVLLRGARALKTDEAVRKMLTDNIDLSSAFAASSLRRAVLMQPKMVGLQGRAVVSLALQAARRGDKLSARDWLRQFNGWLRVFKQQRKDRDTRRWELGSQEVAAVGEAALLAFGAEAGSKRLRSWGPKSSMQSVLLTVVQRLLTRGETALVQASLPGQRMQPVWSVFVYVPLALAGIPVDADALDHVLIRWIRRRWITAEEGWKKLSSVSHEYGPYPTLLVAAETVISRTGLKDGARSILSVFASESWRRPDKLYTGQHRIVDAALRAYTLLEISSGRSPAAESFVLHFDAPLPAADGKEQRAELKRREKRRADLVGHVKKLLPLYIARAEVLLAVPEARAEAFERFGKIVQGHVNGYSYQGTDDLQEMRQHLAYTVADLLQVPELDTQRIAELTLSFSRKGFSNEMQDAVACLAMQRSTHDVILKKVIESAQLRMQAREPATDVATSLLGMARMIALISPDEAAGIFFDASEVLSNVDYDSVHQVGMLESMAKRAVAALMPEQRREAAARFVMVASDTWSYLQDSDRFPWDATVRGVTCLDPCIAMAALGQWDDAGDVEIRHVVSDFLQAAEHNSALSADGALLVVWLSEAFDSNIVDSVTKLEGLGVTGTRQPAVSQELVRLALLNIDGHDGMTELRQALEVHANMPPSREVQEGHALLNFYSTELHRAESVDLTPESSDDDFHESAEVCAVFRGQRFAMAHEIEECYRDWKAHQERAKTYVSTSEFLNSMRQVVSRGDRRAHLEALASAQLGARFQQVDALMKSALEWVPESRAVAAWCRQELPGLLRKELHLFHYSRYQENRLGQLLDTSGLPHEEICNALLDGIENDASEWDSGSVYGLLELLAKYLEPADAATVLVGHLQAEAQRVDHPIAEWSWRDVPCDVQEALGQMVYAFMGDVELARRWTAAHAFRVAARLSLGRVLHSVLTRWNDTKSNAFRAARQPSYWQASRLWLSIALAQVAHETPQALKLHAEAIFRFATDPSFPHVLCREFLVDALRSLHSAGLLAVEQLHTAEQMNRQALQNSKKPTSGRRSKVYDAQEGRRFHFNSTDTLPYWYSPALQIFADVEMPEFLDNAERWILDRWKADPDVWMWDHEPRKSRLGKGLSTMHRHGELPAMERYSTHLEWNAMFCVVGELLTSRPLAKAPNGEYGSLAYFLSGDQLTSPPSWIADLRETKPLHAPFWFNTELDDVSWLEQTDLSSMLKESGIVAVEGEVVVASRVAGQQGDRHWTLNVSTALVSGSTAAALLRSLQNVSRWDYRIPDEGDPLEYGVGDFKLKGWLRGVESSEGIDRHDPYRRSVGRVAVLPGNDVLQRLGLHAEGVTHQLWTDIAGEPVIRYHAWSDDLDQARYAEGSPRLEGYQLIIAKPWLHRYLHKRGMDLILEIGGNRATQEQEYGEDTSTPRTRIEYDHVIVFRRNGTIETADGPIGTWYSAVQGTGHS